MCLILFAYRVHPRYELVLAANRDEFYARPTAPLGFWDDVPDLLAGRDLKEGGTWLGITRRGRFAAITNYRDPSRFRPDAPSRGTLVSDYLSGTESAQEYLARIASRGADYNGFNLLLGGISGLFYYSNQGGGSPRALTPGLYGLSNHLLNTPWPKVDRGRQGLAALLEDGAELTPEALLALLTDRARPADADLPNTGVTLEWERVLSPLFIESPDYGTRSSTALLVEKGGIVQVAEKTWADGKTREFRLQWPVGTTIIVN